MKLLTGLVLMAATFLFSVGSYAQTAGLECSYKSGPGKVEITVLQASEFVVHNTPAVKTVYSCGAFVNDGSVVVDDRTAIVEIASDSCANFHDGMATQLIYCY